MFVLNEKVGYQVDITNDSIRNIWFDKVYYTNI